MNKNIHDRITKLKADRGAVILAHNYQIPSVQELADYVGDSLGLSRRAAETDADVIVFCGVRFMAETASILNPGKKVLLPDEQAGCPMAGMIDAPALLRLREAHPDAAVVCYVNSTAEVKALSDVCCTSSNAVDVVNAIEPDRPIIFVPDRNLCLYVARRTGREIILSRGYCPTHVRILPEHIAELKRAYPEAEVMVHPECLPAVIEMADIVASTSGMLRHARTSSAPVIVVGTEEGLLYRLRRQNLDKEFVGASPAAVCPNMKRITPAKVLWSLEEMQHAVTVPEHVRGPAREAIERMLAIGASAVGTAG